MYMPLDLERSCFEIRPVEPIGVSLSRQTHLECASLATKVVNGIEIASALALAAVVICLIVVEADVLLPRAPVAIVLCAGLLIALPAETGYAFKRLFAVNGTSGLPLTLDQSSSSAGSTARSRRRRRR